MASPFEKHGPVALSRASTRGSTRRHRPERKTQTNRDYHPIINRRTANKIELRTKHSISNFLEILRHHGPHQKVMAE
jgi:hypothetical protein